MFCTIKFVYYKSFCVRDDIGSYIRTVYHMVSHTPKPEVPGSSPGRRARTSEGANTVPFPPHGENCTMLAPSSFSESNPLRWASIRVFKVISRRRRRPIDRWCCFSFPNRTHFIGLRFGPIKEQTPFRFRLTAKTALCWLLLPFPNRTRSAGLRFTFFTTRRASTICACPPSHILSVSHFYFLKNATTTAPGPAWVPITLPTVV